jgi:hypothetical protein
MRVYDIRIVKADNGLALTMSGSYLNDFSAVRAAQILVQTGQFAQVWRDEECIYDDSSRNLSVPRSAA